MSAERRTSGQRGLAIEPAGSPQRRVALPARGVLIVGSEPGSAGLVVQAEGVAKTHVAIAPLKGGGHGVKLIAEAAGATLNGQPIRTAKLSLGDELVLGSARLLVVHTETAPSDDGLASGRTGRDSGEPLRADAIPGFRLIESLGRGAVGRVVLAHQENLDRRVAIKLLDKEHAKDDEFVARFRDEARAAAALHHANVVTVFDVGEADGQPYLVMEYMSRGSLEDRLASEGPLPWRAVLGVLRDAAAALEFAGSKGIVHRDVKPANLMQTNTGETKIADLGLATTNFGGGSAGSGKIQGTPHFMAPEQARGEPVDERADLYALGASAWRLLTGETPFRGKDARSILRAAQTEEPRPPSELAPGCPAGIDALILELMAKRPEQRPRSAAVLKARVEQLIAGNGHRPSAASAGLGLPLKLAAGGLLIAAGAAAWFWSRPESSNEPLGPFATDDPTQIGPTLGGVESFAGPVQDVEPQVLDRRDPPAGEPDPATAPADPVADADPGLSEEERDAAYLREGNAKLSAALALLDADQRREALQGIVADFNGIAPGDAAAAAIAALEGAAPDPPDAPPGAGTSAGSGAGGPAPATTPTTPDDALAPYLEELRRLAYGEERELLPPRVGLAAVASAALPEQARTDLFGEPAALEAFDARRAELLDELQGEVEAETERRLDAAREQATEGAFGAAEASLQELLEWLRRTGDPDAAEQPDGAESGERSTTRVTPLGGGAGRARPAEPADAAPSDELEMGAEIPVVPFDDSFLLTLESRAQRFVMALPELEQRRAAYLRQTDRARLAAALWPDALRQDLERGAHAAAAARVAGLLPELEHPPYREAADVLRRALDAAARFEGFVRASWDAGDWKRQRVQVPGRSGEFAEAVSIDARGISIEGSGGAPELLEWSAFATDPGAVLNLVQERLDRDWSGEERRATGGFLLAGTLLGLRETAWRGLEHNGLPPSIASELSARLEPLASYLEAAPNPELEAALDRERAAAQRVAAALVAAQDQDWSNAAFALGKLLEASSDATLVWMLSNGVPTDEPVVWPPTPWPDAPDDPLDTDSE